MFIVDKVEVLSLDGVSQGDVEISQRKLRDALSESSTNFIVNSRALDMSDVVVKNALGFSSRDFSLSTESGRASFVRPLPLVTEIVKTPSAAVLSASPKSTHEFYLREFRRVANADFLEYGTYTRCDELLGLWFVDLGEKLGPVINYIFLKSMRNKQSALLLLKAVSSLPYDDVEPYGQVQAMAYLPMEDDELAEAGIRAFENWESKSGIEILESAKMREPWLEKYKEATIEYLKGL